MSPKKPKHCPCCRRRVWWRRAARAAWRELHRVDPAWLTLILTAAMLAIAMYSTFIR
ncbi:hypothetical protein GCM10022419_034240 [Nonomuraea rosea]|uniref:Uncharacterized protein n=1 Tax=Nonomuraea rosea TaxID=638574 RepID=A0ABP6WH01_9ACTN